MFVQFSLDGEACEQPNNSRPAGAAVRHNCRSAFRHFSTDRCTKQPQRVLGVAIWPWFLHFGLCCTQLRRKRVRRMDWTTRLAAIACMIVFLVARAVMR